MYLFFNRLAAAGGEDALLDGAARIKLRRQYSSTSMGI
jgi:hypothetical protein